MADRDDRVYDVLSAETVFEPTYGVVLAVRALFSSSSDKVAA